MKKILFHVAFMLLLVCPALAADIDEFKVKRQEVFEFTEPPTIHRAEGADKVEIRFTVKAFCDVTVAIERAQGGAEIAKTQAGTDSTRIIRHLVSGVLGPNAPAPLQKNSLSQTLVWDGKDDQDRLVDPGDFAGLTVRVSLGLKPQFERTLFWSPHKRMANACPLLAATEEGVVMFEGRGVDHARLFDHTGDYLRTIYPFPAGKLDNALGLEKRVFPQDGKELPIKHGFVQASLLTSGTSAIVALPYKFGDGFGASAMAAGAGGRIAVGYDFINRLAMDGTTGGLKLTGPKIGRRATWRGYGGQGGGEEIVGPSSMAFSPDGKWLYLTGFMWREFYMGGADCLHGVLRLAYDRDDEPTVFAGQMSTAGQGSDNAHFRVPSSVACDSQGRVYVSDYGNNRVQIFSPEGKFLKGFAADRPGKVLVSPKNGEIWVFSWPVIGESNEMLRGQKREWQKVEPMLTRFGPFDDPKKLAAQPLPLGVNLTGFFLTGTMVTAAVDWWADPVTVWTVGRKHNISRIDVAWGGSGAYEQRDRDPWMADGVHLLQEKDGRWEIVRDFARDAKAATNWPKPPDFCRQRLVVNPKNSKLYVVEDSGFGKSAWRVPEIDPATGKVSIIDLPFDTEELCFDLDGRAYLRTDTLVARYDPATWREVPWDYGEERQNVGFSTLGAARRANIESALATPGVRPVCWHQGGMSVSPRGNLIISCCSRAADADRREAHESPWERSRRDAGAGKPYTPQIYPGRIRWQEVHVYDSHGQLLYEDAVPGLPVLDGVGMDRDNNVYLMAAPNRVLDGTPYWNEMACTVMKFKPKKAKVISSSSRAAVPLSPESFPKRPKDLVNSMLGGGWVEGAEWFYGGVGFDGFNPSHTGGGCACWNSRFTLDLFGRSFAPEVDHYSVAVVDTNGNLVLRIGRCGNVDDGRPLVSVGGPAKTQAIGGDEVALFHACYVGTETDRRLFIADAGNGRIVSVKLDYHATARALLGK